MVSYIVYVCSNKAITIIKGNTRTANFLVSAAAALLWPRPVDCSYFEITKLDTHTHTHSRLDSSERVIGPSQRPLPTQHTTDTGDEIRALSGIRTHNPRKREAAERRLRPHGYHRDMPNNSLFKDMIYFRPLEL